MTANIQWIYIKCCFLFFMHILWAFADVSSIPSGLPLVWRRYIIHFQSSKYKAPFSAEHILRHYSLLRQDLVDTLCYNWLTIRIETLVRAFLPNPSCVSFDSTYTLFDTSSLWTNPSLLFPIISQKYTSFLQSLLQVSPRNLLSHSMHMNRKNGELVRRSSKYRTEPRLRTLT